MKWVAIIITVMFAAAFGWFMYSGDTGAWHGTPMGPAKNFVYAATEGTPDVAVAYCLPEIEEEAMAIAQRLDDEDVDPRSVVFKESTEGPLHLVALINGNVMAVKVVEIAPQDYMIERIDYDK